MKMLFKKVGAEVTRRTVLTIAAISLLTSAPTARATNYTVTNDLPTRFQVFYWTNSSGTNIQSLATNLPPAGTNLYVISTNGIAGLGVLATNGTEGVFVNWTNMTTGSSFVGSIFAEAMSLLQPAVEQVPQSQTVLKSYFVTGALPGQANYWEWMDTEFWYVNAMYTNSLVANSNATVALAAFQAIKKAGATLTFTRLSGGWTANYFTVALTNCVNVVPSTNFTWSDSSAWTVTVPITFSNTITPLITNTLAWGWGGDAAFGNQVLTSGNVSSLTTDIKTNSATITLTGGNGSNPYPSYSDNLTFWIQ